MPDGHVFKRTVMTKQEGGSQSGLYMFVAVYVIGFAVAAILLLSPGIFPRTMPETNGLVGPEAYGQDAELDCNSMREVHDFKFLASGWTKAVYSGIYLGTPIAIKMVNPNGNSVKKCQEREQNKTVCYLRAADKIIDETYLLRQLVHENIIRVLGTCVVSPHLNPENHVALLTELGEPLDSVRLLQLPWEDRLRLALGMARILHLLAHSPLGSLAMNDFRHQQFVIVDGELKLSDVDDVGVDEPACLKDADCVQMLPEQLQNATWTKSVRCSRQRWCVGHNERVNVLRAGKHFIHQFLPLGAPAGLRPQILDLLKGYRDASWNSSKILTETERLVHSFVSGQYRESNEVVNSKIDPLPGYTMLKGKDLPGQFDYPCPESRSAVNCVSSVHNLQEAAEQCSTDPKCKGFVTGFGYTWTGRQLVIYKSGIGQPTPMEGKQLFVRRDLH